MTPDEAVAAVGVLRSRPPAMCELYLRPRGEGMFGQRAITYLLDRPGGIPVAFRVDNGRTMTVDEAVIVGAIPCGVEGCQQEALRELDYDDLGRPRFRCERHQFARVPTDAPTDRESEQVVRGD